jgi:hypothetical protein
VSGLGTSLEESVELGAPTEGKENFGLFLRLLGPAKSIRRYYEELFKIASCFSD